MRGDLQEGHGCSSQCQSLSFRAQNRGFCAFLGSGTPIFGHFEHKIGVFVRFLPSEPPFSGILSTKSGFLCAFCLRNPRFRAFRAQNRHFCALFAFGTPVFGLLKHKIGVFVRFYQQVSSRCCRSSSLQGTQCRVSRGAATLPHRLPLRSIPPQRFACGSSHSRGHGRPRSVRKSSRLRGKCLSMDCRCSDIANLSAHLHRLPTPPAYLRRMRLQPGRGQVSDGK